MMLEVDDERFRHTEKCKGRTNCMRSFGVHGGVYCMKRERKERREILDNSEDKEVFLPQT